MGRKTETFVEGQMVWVKMRNYPWWPARVAADGSGSITKGRKYHVVYYGDDTHNYTEPKDMRDFAIHLKDFAKPPKKTKGIEEAIQQATDAFHADGVAATAAETGGEDRHGQEGRGATDIAVVHAASTGPDITSNTVQNAAPAPNGGGAGKPEPQSGSGGEDEVGDENEDEDADSEDDTGDHDDESELELSEDSEDEYVAKSKPRQQKRKAAGAATASSAPKRPRGSRNKVVTGAKLADDAPPKTLRHATTEELMELRGSMELGMSQFIEGKELLDKQTKIVEVLTQKLAKAKRQQKVAFKASEDAKAKIATSLRGVTACVVTLPELKQTKWGKVMKKLCAMETTLGDPTLSRLAKGQLERWMDMVQEAQVAPAGSAVVKGETVDSTRLDGGGTQLGTVSGEPAVADENPQVSKIEATRAKARKLLVGALITTSDTDTSASEDRMTKIAAEVEAACFTQCAQSGELDGNYKAKLRVLLASIKQQEKLRSAMLGGRLGAPEAVSMDSEKLLSYL